MDLTRYREGDQEQARIASLMTLVPKEQASVLDVGARDGYISRRLTSCFESVTALDLEKPSFDIEHVAVAQGDIRHLEIPDAAFDTVLCSEVLEHIPPADLSRACAELARIAKRNVLIGVPFQQDIRYGRTTCTSCGTVNGPWGHLNSFDETRLARLFPGLRIVATDLVGRGSDRTNWLSALLMNAAGNPWGTYEQEEPCGHCGALLRPPSRLSLIQKLLSGTAVGLTNLQRRFGRPRPLWIHVLFGKSPSLKERAHV